MITIIKIDSTKEYKNRFLKISMKLALNFSLLLSILFVFGYESLSLTDSQIKKICKKEKKVLNCKKNLQKKRSNLEKGNLIEIPVIHYKR